MAETLGQLVKEVSPPPEEPSRPYVIGGVKETARRMARVVATGEVDDEFAADPENDINLSDQQRGYDIAGAFDRGARLTLPEAPTGPLDESYRAAKERIEAQMGPGGRRPSPAAKRTSTGPKPAGSDELTKLFATGFVTLITFTLGEWALPTAEEATELSRPLANILSRRIDIAAKLGKDGNDTIAFAIAVMAYLVRVGPIASEKVKDAWRERQDRIRVDRVLPGGLGESDGTGGMDDGPAPAAGPLRGATHHPLDAVAATRDAQLRGLDQQFGYDQGPRAAVGHVG